MDSPTIKVTVNHPSDMPLDYGTTPGGTIFSTTPGGTKIIYDRKFLLEMRNSPMSKTPPRNLPKIPGVTTKDEKIPPISPPPTFKVKSEESDDQFQMEMETSPK